ncbi:hypothetical protein D3C71_1799170 [compost metagenome]
MAQLDVADLVADHAAHFIVRGHVHQPGVHAHAAVGHGPGVDVFGQVDLEAQAHAVFIGQTLGDLGQTLGIRIVGGGDLVLLVHVDAGFVGGLGHVLVGQGERLAGLQAGAGQLLEVQRRGGGGSGQAGKCQQQGGG